MSKKFSAEINNFSHDGRGVAKVDGKTVFIEGGLPGETVIFTYSQRRPRYDLGQAVEIINPSKQRVQPLCRHFDYCGGCALQHMAQEAQLDMKQKLLFDNLKHFAGVLPEACLPPIKATAFHYRRRARLGVKYIESQRKVILGFREKTSHKIADLEYCETLHPRGAALLGPLKGLISELEGTRSISQIEITVAEKLTALIFRHLKPLSLSDETKLIAFAKEKNLALYLQPEKEKSLHLLWGPLDLALGYSLPEYDIQIQFQPIDFTQVNWDINPLMVEAALKQLDPKPSDVILDLFCGLGNFTLALGRRAKKVVGLEGSPSLVERAFQNALANQLSNVEYYSVDLEKALPDRAWINQEYDKVLLDPPRTGALELMHKMVKWNPKTIVYVSCNPATLARDIGILVKQSDYRLVSAGVMDMFPQTMHVESMAVLERN